GMDEKPHTSSENGHPPVYLVWLCGSFQVERWTEQGYVAVDIKEWGGHSSPRTVLKALLCAPRRRARRGTLLAQIWPEAEEEPATRDLAVGISRLRKVLSHPGDRVSLLRTEPDSLGFSLVEQGVLWVDADAALALLTEVERLGPLSPAALPVLEEAWRLLRRGAFLEHDEGEWAENQRAVLHRWRYRCQRWLAEASLEQGDPGQAETLLNELLGEDPTDEDVIERLMRLWHQRGLTQQALQLYKQSRETCANEGLELSEAIQDYAQRLREERSSLARESAGQENRELAGLVSASPMTFAHLLSTELSSEDTAIWFGIRSAHIVSLVHHWKKQALSCDILQGVIDREIAMFEKIRDTSTAELFTLSRRQALIALAALPTMLTALIQGQPFGLLPEEFLPQCAASLTACWHLLRGQEFLLVEKVLTRYLPT
ncbi:MAG: AfsR/SARP family transcriptional regulator, partial [Ktedonobacteraceae bacterium]